MNLSRRSILIGSGVTALSAAVGPYSSASAAARTTIILSPHQDDEVARLSHYSTIAADRGDRMILVQVTDGAATRAGRTLGLTPRQVTSFRNREQRHAWEWLTDGRGEVVYLNLPDGGAHQDDIYSGVSSVIGAGVPAGTEIYVATYHYDRPQTVSADRHTDHVATVDAARRLGADGLVVRYALHPTAVKSGVKYHYRNASQKSRVRGAIGAYTTVGHVSTNTFSKVLDTPNYVTR